MGTFSIGHLLIIVIAVLLIFGAGRVPRLMGDLAKGLRAFREGMKEEETSAPLLQEESSKKNSSPENKHV